MKTPELTEHTRTLVLSYTTYGLFASALLMLCYFFGLVNGKDLWYLLPTLPIPFSNIYVGVLWPEGLSGWNKTCCWVYVVGVILLAKSFIVNFNQSSFIGFLFGVIFLVIQWKILRLL